MLKQKQVCMISIFPPPLHGMSLVNDYVRRRLTLNSLPLVIDLSPRNLDRACIVRIGKIFRVLRGIVQFVSYLVRRKVGVVYLGLSGGNGQIYDVFFTAISRVFGRKLYLHHHGYEYLIRHKWLSWLLFRVAGRDSIHVVACEKMASDLCCLYSYVKQVRVVSGIAVLDDWKDDVNLRTHVHRIGFLGNISIEKGILEFLSVATLADHARLSIKFLIAGPYMDDKTKRLVESRVSALSNVCCVGPVYGSEKRSFFDSIDVFLMPSHQESEGLVIHEAMSRGVPVIAYSRGCIEQIISDHVGLCVAPVDVYVEAVINKLKEWQANPHSYQLVSQAALMQYNNTRLLESVKMDALCAELVEKKI